MYDGPRCCHCGSDDMWWSGWYKADEYVTGYLLYKYTCRDCGRQSDCLIEQKNLRTMREEILATQNDLWRAYSRLKASAEQVISFAWEVHEDIDAGVSDEDQISRCRAQLSDLREQIMRAEILMVADKINDEGTK